ncbi:hypothetical protein [Saccharothrix australiensis]|uniref:DUF5666 domain-containing protein n=1 Tax=Saccharothrix australiensis TaxID=2072 RepID=A0A495VXG7_9PSEU|nr:hypothetical protein [Saccharothrix australiensis]RKT53949.1 hypothetical protein C8E97_2537 [Saccharothrix australiensis]
MTTETENPTWGEPPPEAAEPGPRRSGRRTLAAVAVAVGIAAVGGGVIYAASNSDAARLGGPRGNVVGGPGLVVAGGGPFGDKPHGEFQNGEVTEVSDTSLTVKSTDGFTRTYRLTDDTAVNGAQGASGLAQGDDVMVLSTDGSTADTVVEANARGGPGNRQQPGRGDGRPQPGQGDGRDQPGTGQGDQQGQPPTR